MRYGYVFPCYHSPCAVLSGCAGPGGCILIHTLAAQRTAPTFTHYTPMLPMLLLLVLLLCTYVCFTLPSTSSGLQFVSHMFVHPSPVLYPHVFIFFPLQSIYIAVTYCMPQKLLALVFLVVRI
ncbi:hypothetical protein BC827DRAFT_1205012, partial [Russula dissimulans]